jgi:lipoprotein-anchoring transpeptidase ErfK/SrfK
VAQGPAAGPAEPSRRLDRRRPGGPAADALAGRDQRSRAARDRAARRPPRAALRRGRWRAGTPTPRGRFAIYEIDRQPDPFGFLGPVALHLTAHSDVLDDYGGGPGRVALHGRGGASLLDPLGSAASHGCIRVDSREAAWLARKVQPGVPVTIT